MQGWRLGFIVRKNAKDIILYYSDSGVRNKIMQKKKKRTSKSGYCLERRFSKYSYLSSLTFHSLSLDDPVYRVLWAREETFATWQQSSKTCSFAKEDTSQNGRQPTCLSSQGMVERGKWDGEGKLRQQSAGMAYTPPPPQLDEWGKLERREGRGTLAPALHLKLWEGLPHGLLCTNL